MGNSKVAKWLVHRFRNRLQVIFVCCYAGFIVGDACILFKLPRVMQKNHWNHANFRVWYLIRRLKGSQFTDEEKWSGKNGLDCYALKAYQFVFTTCIKWRLFSDCNFMQMCLLVHIYSMIFPRVQGWIRRIDKDRKKAIIYGCSFNLSLCSSLNDVIVFKYANIFCPLKARLKIILKTIYGSWRGQFIQYIGN